MTLLEHIRDYISDFSARRRYRRTERMMASLPAEVRKDIGWPGSARGLRRRRS